MLLFTVNGTVLENVLVPRFTRTVPAPNPNVFSCAVVRIVVSEDAETNVVVAFTTLPLFPVNSNTSPFWKLLPLALSVEELLP